MGNIKSILVHVLILSILIPLSIFAMYKIATYSFTYFNFEQFPDLITEMRERAEQKQQELEK